MKRAVDVACMAVLLGIAVWFSGRSIGQCRDTRDCEESGGFETKSCRASIGRQVVCEWHCVERSP